MTHHKQGFTLVEMMLSMTFIAVLLLAIAALVLQISSIYTKGLTLRAVNDVGRTVTADIQRTLNTSVPQNVMYVSNTTGGRLCAGNTVYAWNYGDFLSSGGFNTTATSGSSNVRLAKFQSGGVSYCVRNGGGVYPGVPNASTSLITNGDANIVIRGATFSENNVTGDATQKIYLVRMTIGTPDNRVITGENCNASLGRNEDDYCAVNVFEFTARAGGKEQNE